MKLPVSIQTAAEAANFLLCVFWSLVLSDADDSSTDAEQISEISESFSPELYALIAQQPFFKALNSQQLKLLATSALEMKFETGATIFEEGSPANRFFLFLTGRVQLSSEMGVRVAIFGSAWVIYAFPSCIFKAGACRT